MWLQQKYISLLHGTLPRLTKKGAGVWNFRCPFCGDSQKSKTKARGYLLTDRQTVYSVCHNCGVSYKFDKFLQLVNPYLFQQYLVEKLTDNDQRIVKQQQEKVEYSTAKLLSLPRISLLNDDHPAVQYLRERNIPRRFESKLYYADDFNAFAREFFTDKYQSPVREQRIIIPLIYNGKLVGFQGRAIDPDNKVRYITASFNQDDPKIFGTDSVDWNTTNYAFEGPFDSMFVHNGFAVLGGSIEKALIKAKLPTDRTVVCYDNEPRNPNIVRMLSNAIANKFAVFIWPLNINEKDINDIFNERISRGLTTDQATEQIRTMIDNHTYRGLNAELRLMEWKR